MQQRLKLYEQHQPYRDQSPPPAPTPAPGRGRTEGGKTYFHPRPELAASEVASPYLPAPTVRNSCSRFTVGFAVRGMMIAMRSKPTLMTVLTGCAVGGLWVGCILLIGSSPGLGGGGHVPVAAVFAGICAALYRLFRSKENVWTIAMALAPFVVIIPLLIVAALVHFLDVSGIL